MDTACRFTRVVSGHVRERERERVRHQQQGELEQGCKPKSGRGDDDAAQRAGGWGQANKHTSTQARKHASKQAHKHTSTQASKHGVRLVFDLTRLRKRRRLTESAVILYQGLAPTVLRFPRASCRSPPFCMRTCTHGHGHGRVERWGGG